MATHFMSHFIDVDTYQNNILTNILAESAKCNLYREKSYGQRPPGLVKSYCVERRVIIKEVVIYSNYTLIVIVEKFTEFHFASHGMVKT